MESFRLINVLLLGVCICSMSMLCVTGQSCQQGTDCAHNQCCVLDRSVNQGVCKLMGGITARCYVLQNYAFTRPVAMITNYDLCPCSTGNICGSINSYDPVYGQKGICTFGK